MAQRADKSGKVRLVALMLPKELEAVQEYARAQGRSVSTQTAIVMTGAAEAWKRGQARRRGRGKVEKVKG